MRGFLLMLPVTPLLFMIDEPHGDRPAQTMNLSADKGQIRTGRLGFVDALLDSIDAPTGACLPGDTEAWTMLNVEFTGRTGSFGVPQTLEARPLAVSEGPHHRKPPQPGQRRSARLYHHGRVIR